MFNPTPCSSPSRAEPVSVNAKLTRNWMVRRLSFPNMMMEMRAERTNIQAKEQMKPVKSALLFIHEAKSGMEPATVVRAD